MLVSFLVAAWLRCVCWSVCLVSFRLIRAANWMLCSGRRETENHWARFICRFKKKKENSARRFETSFRQIWGKFGARSRVTFCSVRCIRAWNSKIDRLIWMFNLNLSSRWLFYFLSLIRFLHRSRLKPSNVLWFECNWPLLLLPSNQIQSKSWGLLGGKDTGASWKRRCHRIPALIFQQNVSWLATGKSKTSENRSLGAPLFFF